MPVLNVNTDAVVKFTNKLEQLSHTALPNVVRATLNQAALDVKKTTMPAVAREVFTVRRANFFIANSRVEFAQGHDINTMRASVGFMETNLAGDNNYSVKDLQQQEAGGRISNKSFIALDTARVGKTIAGNVKAGYRLTAIQKIIDARREQGKNNREKFTKAAVKAGQGGTVLADAGLGNTILWRINSVHREGRNTVVNSTPIYDFKKGRSVTVKPTHFMQRATELTARKLEGFFIENAEKRFERELR
jgi:hypothetical protein